MTTTTTRIRRIALLSGASLALTGVAFAPQALATGAPSPNPTGQVMTPNPVVAGQVIDSTPVALCFGRPVTHVVPAGGADFYGSPDAAVIDVILGTSGEDRIFAQGGNDFVCGGDAYDYIDGGPGNDWIDGEQGGDSLYGGTGTDVIYGGAGGDLLLGDEGDDILFGQREDDEFACDQYPGVPGEGQSDVADGGLGVNDNLIGGQGSGCESVVNVEYP
jgi:RTX calcium-binding nonapeptide repeat (4 copies)